MVKSLDSTYNVSSRRILISGEWADLYPQCIQVALSKPTSDHCSIVLDSRLESWGPKPFQFELMWLEEKGFKDLIRAWWSGKQVQGWAGFRLASKMRCLKANIKVWAKDNFGSVEASMAELLTSIKELDSKGENESLRNKDFS